MPSFLKVAVLHACKVPPFPKLVVLLCWQSASFCQGRGFAMLAKCLILSRQGFCCAGKMPPFSNLVVLLCWQSASFCQVSGFACVQGASLCLGSGFARRAKVSFFCDSHFACMILFYRLSGKDGLFMRNR